jgi:hypothetical protein
MIVEKWVEKIARNHLIYKLNQKKSNHNHYNNLNNNNNINLFLN